MSPDMIIKDCRGKEFYAFGTHRIFDQRARKLQLYRTWITFLGIITPLFVGGVVLSFGTESKVLPWVITVVGIIGLVQLVLSAFSIVSRWDEKYEYALDSSRGNTDLYNRFKFLADNAPADLEVQYKDAIRENEAREFKDLGQGITEKEKRFANREALKYYRKPCSICSITPTNSKPSKCDGCGNF
jgi:mobilome CxxCx(11)CxxC protein